MKRKPSGMTGGKKRPKPKTISQLKKKLDTLFSLYIRAKYPAKCYTCGANSKALQCGHFVARSYLATRFDENNCRPQCVGCNIFGRGKPLEFEDNLKAELGAKAVEALKKKRLQITILSTTWYEEQIEAYKQKLAAYE